MTKTKPTIETFTNRARKFCDKKSYCEVLRAPIFTGSHIVASDTYRMYVATCENERVEVKNPPLWERVHDIAEVNVRMSIVLSKGSVAALRELLKGALRHDLRLRISVSDSHAWFEVVEVYTDKKRVKHTTTIRERVGIPVKQTGFHFDEFRITINATYVKSAIFDGSELEFRFGAWSQLCIIQHVGADDKVIIIPMGDSWAKEVSK